MSAEYGQSPEHPLEWGPAASGVGSAFLARLTCSSGASARLERTGNVGPAPRESSTERCGPFAAIDGPDRIDRWEARCPGEPTRVWFTNAYRCGAMCAPAGISLLPEGVVEATRAVEQAMERGDVDTAEAEARRALDLAPASELANRWMGTVLLVSGRGQEARPHFERALAARPGDPYHRLHLALAQQDDDYATYARTVAELRAELATDHPLHAELVCRDAHSMRRDERRRDEAIASARAACEAGFAPCCAFEPEPPE